MSTVAGSVPPAAHGAVSPDQKTEDAVRRYILTELAAVPQRRLDLDTPLFETLLDSTSVLALVSHLEDNFAIDIRDSEVVPDNFSSLRRIVAYIARKQEPAAAPLAASG